MIRSCIWGGLSLIASTLGCQAQGQPSAPVRGGVFEYGINASPTTYDCHAASSATALMAVGPFYSSLIKYDPANYPKLVGDAAESWNYSEDRKTITFKLRPGIRFHDGSHLTSSDVKATFDRIVRPPDGVVSFRQAFFQSVDRIDAPDPSTVVFRLNSIDVSLLEAIASPYNCLYSAAKLAADPRYPDKNILGSGAFMLGSHSFGSDITGKRFDGYFVKDKPYLDGFRGVFLSQSSAMLNSLQGGVIKADFRGITPAERDRLVSALGSKIVTKETAQISNLRLSFNTTRPPFDDVRVRRALNLAIDRWSGAAGLQKTTRMGPVGGLFLPGSDFAASETQLSTYPGFGKKIEEARTEARELLKQAGHEKLTFTLINRDTSPYSPVGVFLIDQWRRIGVVVEHRPMEVSSWSNALSSGNYSAIIDFVSADVADPSFMLSQYISIDRSPGSPGRHTDRTLDELYDRQRATTDDRKRLELLREFEKRIMDQQYSVPILWVNRIVAHWSNVQGWHLTPSQVVGQDLVDVWLSSEPKP